MNSCLVCHVGFLSGASHETDAWAVLLFQNDSYPWVGQLSKFLLELEATNCSKVVSPRWKIRYLSANIAMSGGKGLRAAYAAKKARLSVAGVLGGME